MTVSSKMKFWLVIGEGFVFDLTLVCVLNFIRMGPEREGFFFFLKVHNLVLWLRTLAELFPTCVILASDLSSLGCCFLIYKMDVPTTVPGMQYVLNEH